MDGVDLEVLRKSAEWLDSGKRVLLVTVVKTWGSSPRTPGALLAARGGGIGVGGLHRGGDGRTLPPRGPLYHAAAGGDLRRLLGRCAQVRAALRRNDSA